jgi:High potential iron-sulfur protein
MAHRAPSPVRTSRKEFRPVAYLPLPYPSRRRFLTALAATGCAGLAVLPLSRSLAQSGSSLPHLSEDDPLAKALGYKSDATMVDRGKFPTYKPGQGCATCRFYQGTAGQEFGPCQVFAGKAVSIKGWCVSFSAKS